MKRFTLSIVVLLLFAPCVAMSGNDERDVRSAIQAFHKAFDDGFTGPADYATPDWNHINPYGGRDRGREATLKTVRQVHQTFLKGTTDTIEDMDIRFATSQVAVATVLSVMSPFTSPDGVNHGTERHIRTLS
jgi:ketosteroid isomerase-like protein